MKNNTLLLNEYQKRALKKAIMDNFRDTLASAGMLASLPLVDTKGAQIADKVIKLTQSLLEVTERLDKPNKGSKTKKNVK